MRVFRRGYRDQGLGQWERQSVLRVYDRCITIGTVNSTLTIRLAEEQRRKLQHLASRLGKSASELVRQMIERGLAEESVGRRIAHLRGSLSGSPEPDDELARSIRERNWRS